MSLNNNLIRRYKDVSSQNNLLSNRKDQQPAKINDPTKIREAILEQRKIDNKMDINQFNKMVNVISTTKTQELDKLWAGRTNQPYKNITPAECIKPKYASADELVIYKVKPEDKSSKLFEEHANQIKQSINEHNKELKDTFSVIKEAEHKKQFEYNHKEKYNVKYDPAKYEEMKADVIDFYKQEQMEEERNKKDVDDLIEKMITTGIMDMATSDKYANRQKKV